MQWKRRTLAMTAAAVAVGAGAVGAALAASGGGSPKEAAGAFVHDVATRLGVSDEKLTAAIKDASAARIDQALKDGEITTAQADELKAKLESGDAPLLGLPRLGHEGRFGRRGPRLDVLSAAATYLGTSRAELRTSLTGGKSLADLAKVAGKSTGGLKDAITAAMKAKLDKRVEAGELTAEQEQTVLAKFTSHLDDLIAGKRPMGMPGRGFGPMGHAGPMGDRGATDGTSFVPPAAA